MDVRNLSFLLKSCIAAKSLSQGKLLHSKSISLGLQNNPIISKTLVNFYISFHLFDVARLVLNTSQNSSDLSSWNGLLAAYSKNRLYGEALHLFDKICRSLPFKPDGFTYPSALKACGGLGGAREGQMIHAHLLKSGFGSDVVVLSTLVGMYAKCDLFELAIQVFDEMPEKDVACWNMIISCYYQDGQALKALESFKTMKSQGFEPDSVTFTTALSACARLLDLERGRRIHGELARRGLELDGFISSAIVDMYGKCGCLGVAREVFEKIPRKGVVSWNSMIGGYSLVGDIRSCLELFARMNEEGVRPTSTTISGLLMACSKTNDVSKGKFIHGYVLRNHMEVDIFVGSSLIDIYFKCGSVGFAESLFREMPAASVVTWNVRISGYVASGCYFKALDAFNEMRTYSVRPDAFTFASALSACAQLAALEQGAEIHKEISRCGLVTNEIVMCALLDMYAKCGAVKEARLVFDGLAVRDTVSWTSMIMAYGSHGQASKALELFQEMEKLKARPDGVTFLAVISACVHGGLVDEGRYYFDRMITEYEIKPGLEHCSCLIDLLGRSGRLKEAYNILKNMPSTNVDAGLLGSLFSACSLRGDLEIGEEVAGLLIEMDPDDHSTYIVLSNMYASAGKWDEVRRVRAEIKERGLKKKPGCSWIEIDRKIHQFYVEDDSHQQKGLIYECLEDLLRHMEKDRSQFFRKARSMADQALCIE